jgi:hypothetical protein
MAILGFGPFAIHHGIMPSYSSNENTANEGGSNDDLVMELYDGALLLPSSEREPWLASKCGADQGLLEEVLNLVRREEEMRGFLPEPVVNRRLPAREIFRVGAVVNGRFRIVRESGRGRRCVVFEALDMDADRRVAIRCALPRVADGTPQLTPPLPVLAHAGICGILGRYTAESEEGTVEFAAVEFQPGESLELRLRRRILKPEHARQIVADIAPVLLRLDRAGGGTAARDWSDWLTPAKILVWRDAGTKLRARLVDAIGLGSEAASSALPEIVQRDLEKRLTHGSLGCRLAPALAVSVLALAACLCPAWKPGPGKHTVLAVVSPIGAQAGADQALTMVLEPLQSTISAGPGEVALLSRAETGAARVFTPEQAYSALAATHVLSVREDDGTITAIIYDSVGARMNEWRGPVADADAEICTMLRQVLGNGGCPSGTTGSPTVRSELAAADTEQLRGNQADMIGHRTRAVRLAPHNAELWRGLAQAYANHGNRAAAIASWRGAIAAQPGYLPSYLELGQFHLRSADAGAAEAVFRHVTGWCPGSAEAWRGLGAALLQQGRKAEADQAGLKARSLNTSGNQEPPCCVATR